VGPQEVHELDIHERPPSTLRNIDSGTLGGVGAGDPGSPTIDAKKRRRWGPREVPELKIQEGPPSTLRNVDSGPPKGAGAEVPGTPTINAKKRRRRTPERCRI
jgi:ribosomal protein S30